MEYLKKRELFRARPGIRMILGFVLLSIGVSSQNVCGEESRWSFSAGFKRFYNIDTDIRGGSSYSAGQYGTGAGLPVTGIGSDTATADRDYDDGYVYRDVGTDVPGPHQGLTWNYEYQNPSQYNVGADTLNFTKTASSLNGVSDPAFREFEDDNN